MKRFFLWGSMVLTLLLAPTIQSDAQLIDAIREALIAAIKAADIAVQKVQNATIDLQNAQKVVENELSQLNLSQISDWEQKTKDLYGNYFDELKKVKTVISYMKEIKGIINEQKQLVGEYKTAFRLIQQDQHFSPGEVQYIHGVYTGIIAQSVESLDQIIAVLTDFSLQMNDAGRLKIIREASLDIEGLTTDLRAFNNRVAQTSIQRGKNQQEINSLKQLYGLPH